MENASSEILLLRTLYANHRYVKKASTEVGSAAAGREDKKVKNTAICQKIIILCSLASTIKTYGAQAINLIKQIGEKLSTFDLMHSISMAIQRGSAVCVRGCQKKHQQAKRASSIFQEAEMQ